ncbi:glycosyl hydrolase 20, domain 2 family protein, partial [Vibrio parahaemolyticus VPTS-2010]
CTFT